MTDQPVNGAATPSNPVELMVQAAQRYEIALVKAHAVGGNINVNPLELWVRQNKQDVVLGALADALCAAGLSITAWQTFLAGRYNELAEGLEKPQIAIVPARPRS